MFIAAQLTIIKYWACFVWPSTDELIKKIWYLYKIYAVTNKDIFESFIGKRMHLETMIFDDIIKLTNSHISWFLLHKQVKV